MTVHDPLTTLSRIVPGPLVPRVAAEIARLERERDTFKRGVNENARMVDEQRNRAEAAEAEIARLRDGLRRIAEDYHCVVLAPDPDEGTHLDGCVGCLARALLDQDGAA